VAVLRRKPVEATPNTVESVYRRRHREFLRVATAIPGSAELGEDAVQEGLARALSRRSTFRASETVEAWLWKVIVNAARNLASRAPRSESLQNEEMAGVDRPMRGDTRSRARPRFKDYPVRDEAPRNRPSWHPPHLKTADRRKAIRGFKSHPRRFDERTRCKSGL
jgi:DNA-directed RNA polymerase specialized sigma24 family protein